MSRKVKDEIRLVRLHWRNYVYQCLLASISMFFILLFLEQGEEVIMASLGATAFVVFALPEKVTAQPRNVIGGHLVGMACGVLGYLILHQLPNPEQFIAEAGIHAFAVGLSIFIMVIINTEHPPASGTALGVAIHGLDERTFISIVSFAIAFTLIRLALKKNLRDLT